MTYRTSEAKGTDDFMQEFAAWEWEFAFDKPLGADPAAEPTVVVWAVWKRALAWTGSIVASWALLIGCVVSVRALFV